MADRYLARLRELGFDLPPVGGSGGNYVPSRRTGNLLYISGQISAIGDEITFAGKLGAEVTVAEGRKAAELCALNLVAQFPNRPPVVIEHLGVQQPVASSKSSPRRARAAA